MMRAEIWEAVQKLYAVGILVYFAAAGIVGVSISDFSDWASFMGRHAVYAFAWPVAARLCSRPALSRLWPAPLGPAASRGVKPRGCRPRGSPSMRPSNDAIPEIAKALRRHVDAATLEKIVNELLDVRGNRDFRRLSR